MFIVGSDSIWAPTAERLAFRRGGAHFRLHCKSECPDGVENRQGNLQNRMSRAGAAWKFGPKSNVASRNLGKRSESAGRLSIAQSIIWPRFGL
jgi:hypothetical protein